MVKLWADFSFRSDRVPGDGGGARIDVGGGRCGILASESLVGEEDILSMLFLSCSVPV